MWYEAVVTGKKVYLIGTPGFDDSRRPDSEIMYDIRRHLFHEFSGDKLLKGLIYLYDISNNRNGGAAIKVCVFLVHLICIHYVSRCMWRAPAAISRLRFPPIEDCVMQNIEDFEHLVGIASFPNVVLVTSRWLQRPDSREAALEQERERKLRSTYWKHMLDGGSSMLRHDGTRDSAELIVDILIEQPKFVQIRRDSNATQDEPREKANSPTREEPSESSASYRKEI
jgi:hypothetical protein